MMTTIEEIRVAEKKVQRALDALKKAPANDPNHLADELQKATDEYARLIRELKVNLPGQRDGHLEKSGML